MEGVQKSTVSIVEKIFVKSGEITAIRVWNGCNLYELDIHLPNVEFSKWDKAQSIKCRISALHYTDYTPAMWNNEEKSCTLYIDTSHNGQGSIWAKNQRVGNPFYYAKIEAEKHFPIPNKHLVFIGDQTGIGHFCSLQQLADKNTKISGFITFNDKQTADCFYQNCPWLPLQTVSLQNDIYYQTKEWLNNNQYQKDNFVFYVVGSAELIVSIRRLLKTYEIDGSQIESKGFWH